MEGALKLQKVLKNYKNQFAIEVTLNTPDAYKIIETLIKEEHDSWVGAGTVTTLEEAQKVIELGVKFILGPTLFSKEIIEYCEKNNVMSIPGAFSPSEIKEQFNYGANIVKVFPANTLGPKFFKDVQAPLGELNLMAVGGINSNNFNEYFDNKVKYVGIGAGLFEGQSLDDLSENEIVHYLEKYI